MGNPSIIPIPIAKSQMENGKSTAFSISNSSMGNEKWINGSACDLITGRQAAAAHPS